MTQRKESRERALAVIRDFPDRVRRIFDRSPGRDARPLEILTAALDDLEGRIVAVGGGKRVLPYNRITVRFVAPAQTRVALETTFKDYITRVRQRLAELRCEPPDDLQVRFEYLKKPRADWPEEQTFDVEYDRHERPIVHDTPVLHLKVTAGRAVKDRYVFTESVIRVGRTAELRDRLGNVRHNEVVFLDDRDPVNQTVGRAHCHFTYDPARSEYRLFDDGSSNGTVVVRSGETIRVPPRDPVGVRVGSGDEVKLGDACLKIVLRSSVASDGA